MNEDDYIDLDAPHEIPQLAALRDEPGGAVVGRVEIPESKRAWLENLAIRNRCAIGEIPDDVLELHGFTPAERAKAAMDATKFAGKAAREDAAVYHDPERVMDELMDEIEDHLGPAA